MKATNIVPLHTTLAKKSATKAETVKRETIKVTTNIPRSAMLVYRTVAEHFGTAPEAIMQCEAFSQLGCIYDSPFRFLDIYDKYFRDAKDLEPAELTFIPSAHCLLEKAAAIVRRPLSELISGMLASSADTLACEAREAESSGGLDECSVVVEMAEEWLRFEFEARRGRMPYDRSGFTPWETLEMDHHRPSVFTH